MALLETNRLRGGLIVSVQAPEGSPLRQPAVIAAMAEASLANGAVGVRLESPEHIGAVRRRCPDALIIGLWKRTSPDGADLIALDATARPRPHGADLAQLLRRCHAELGAPLMADVDSVAAGLRAAELGCAWVGTTLYGYTEATAALPPPALALLPELRAGLPPSTLLICEGGIGSPAQAQEALRQGADAVVVGTAITGVDLQVANYVKKLGGGCQGFS
jgi:N-acylglucosamine-6-phosphate 2-epimerase